jgi:hypothetical protein
MIVPGRSYQNVVDLKAEIFKESDVVLCFKMSDNGVNMCTKRAGCFAAKDDARMPKLYVVYVARKKKKTE